MTLIIVDVEAAGTTPIKGTMTEFGAVEFKTRQYYHGRIHETTPDPINSAIPIVGQQLRPLRHVMQEFSLWIENVCKEDGRPIFVSDNPAYDFMWIATSFDRVSLKNPFGHSARRIGDFAAGLRGDFFASQSWKSLRRTPHNHHPVNDAMGNAEALHELIATAQWKG